MSKFKKGDRVRIVNQGTSCNESGDVGTIIHVDMNSISQQYRVQVKGRRTDVNWSYEEDLELVEEKPLRRTKEIEVYVDGNMYWEEDKLVYGNYHTIYTSTRRDNEDIKAKLIVELPEKKIELTESEFEKAWENNGINDGNKNTLKKELGF